jgi:hypothetical protein
LGNQDCLPNVSCIFAVTELHIRSIMLENARNKAYQLTLQLNALKALDKAENELKVLTDSINGYLTN